MTLDDFELLIRGEPIEKFYVDRVCRDSGGEPTPNAVAEAGDEAPAAIETTNVPSRVAPANYLFYFDQAFLTIEGRVQRISLADRKPTWSKRVSGSVYRRVLLADDRVIVFDDALHVTTFEAATGKQLWQVRLPGEIQGDPVLHGNQGPGNFDDLLARHLEKIV